jgi:K+/H+ antiporter YhaU regulatory subunit KhtT
MSSLYFLFPTLLAILISFLFVRAAGIALMMTGLEKKKARFQALSAFSGTGFTTKEAELVINHPVRRKIVTWLMIMGNAGVATVIVTATSSLATSRGYQLPINVLVLIVGIFLIYKIATYKKFTRKWENFIEKKLIKSPTFEEAATEDLLHFLEGYGLIKKIISEKSSLIGSSLSKCRLSEKGLLVLGIERGKNWIPTPKANEKLLQGDNLVVYGPLDVLKNLLKEEKAC